MAGSIEGSEKPTNTAAPNKRKCNENIWSQWTLQYNRGGLVIKYEQSANIKYLQSLLI